MLVGCLEVDGKLVQNGSQAEPFCLQTHLKIASKWSGTKMEQLPLPVFSLSIILELHKGPAQGAFEIPPPQPFAGVAQLARAFGSYPECHWFESDRRYQQKPFRLKDLDGFFLFKSRQEPASRLNSGFTHLRQPSKVAQNCGNPHFYELRVQHCLTL